MDIFFVWGSYSLFHQYLDGNFVENIYIYISLFISYIWMCIVQNQFLKLLSVVYCQLCHLTLKFYLPFFPGLIFLLQPNKSCPPSSDKQTMYLTWKLINTNFFLQIRNLFNYLLNRLTNDIWFTICSFQIS